MEATKNHSSVCIFYLYKEKKFLKKEAQKWWIYKSLKNFQEKLKNFNISLQAIKVDSYKDFYENLIKKKNFSIYWNKVYDPIILNLTKLFQIY